MLTVAEAARRAGRNPETVRRWIREGKLTAWKVGSQHVIDEDDLTQTLADGGAPRRGQPGIISDPMDRALRPTGHDWLPNIVGRIVRAIDPRRIILFGSRARGDARPESDYDLLVILDEVGDRRAS